MISIIILAYNEEAWIGKILDNLDSLPASRKKEIILADGGSTDQTVTIASNRANIVMASKGKARQMNAGAKAAKGDLLFFVHADMELAPNTLEAMEQKMDQEGYDGGGFGNVFDRHNAKIKRLGNILNFRLFDKREQSDKGIFYGDNGIFVRKQVFEKLGGFKDIPIMEDYDFSLRMSKHFKTIKIYDPPITVSARRHEKAGFWTTRLQWVLIKKLYLMGVSPQRLAAWYKDVR